MNRPSFPARLMGARLVSLALCVAAGALVLGWYADNAPWWLAMLAMAAAVRSLSAVGEVRRYKRWRAEWQAIVAPVDALPDAPPSPRAPERPKRRCKLVTVAALLFMAIPAFLGQQQSDGWDSGTDGLAAALTCLWYVVCGYLSFRVTRGILRRVKKRHAAKVEIVKAEEEAAPVALLVPRASSSPSRASAERNLPEYSARLIGRG